MPPLVLYEKSTADAGMSKLHGLRHEYAQRRYHELTGWLAPVAGGPAARDLTTEQKVLDRSVRLLISEELGHSREQTRRFTWDAKRGKAKQNNELRKRKLVPCIGKIHCHDLFVKQNFLNLIALAEAFSQLHVVNTSDMIDDAVDFSDNHVVSF